MDNNGKIWIIMGKYGQRVDNILRKNIHVNIKKIILHKIIKYLDINIRLLYIIK